MNFTCLSPTNPIHPMKTTIRDGAGNALGTISNEGGRQVARTNGGTLVGTFDGKITRDARGNVFGNGNQLAALIRG